MVARIPSLVLVQVAFAVAAFASLALWPPVSGRLLLVPLASGSGATVGAAVAGGALLLGAGPLPGSQVVLGDRAAIVRQAGWWRMLVLAAPPAGCGDTPSEKVR